jgi:hypothetical protein
MKMILDNVFAFSGNCVYCAWVATGRVRERADFFFGNECSIIKVENVLDVGRLTCPLFRDRRWATDVWTWAHVWSCPVSMSRVCRPQTSFGLGGTGRHRLLGGEEGG